MNTVKVKDVIFGEGRPKICTPIVEKTKNKIIEEALNISKTNTDLVEWRVDWFEKVYNETNYYDVYVKNRNYKSLNR